MMGTGFRLEAGSRFDPFFLLDLKWRTIRVSPAYVGWEVGGGMFLKASVMLGCRDDILTSRGEGLSGRSLHSDTKMSRHRWAIGRFVASEPEIFRFRRRQSSGFFEESSVLKYLMACVSFWGKGNTMEGFAIGNLCRPRSGGGR